MKKSEFKSLADAIGMPDDEDYKYIHTLIMAYDRAHPGELTALRNKARNESTAGSNDWGLVKSKGITSSADSLSGHRYMLELPAPLHAKIEKYIPTMFSDKKHFAWFKKKFPHLLIPRKF